MKRNAKDCKTSVMVPIYKGKGDVKNFSAYRGVKLLEHEMKIIERVLEKRIKELVEVDDMHFGFIPKRGKTDDLFYSEKNARGIQGEG